MTLTARELIPEHLPELSRALGAAQLPADDIAEDNRRFFAFSDEGRIVGYAGAEFWDGEAMLRSVVVLPEFRGQGHGAAIITWMLDWLSNQGIDEPWLLTTSIEPLMLRFGFQRAERELAPQSVKSSRQFTGLCPSSAVLMRRHKP